MVIDFGFFNDLSYPISKPTSEEIKHFLRSSLAVMKEAKKLGFRKIRTQPDFKSRLLIDGSIINQVIMSMPETERRLLLSILGGEPYICRVTALRLTGRSDFRIHKLNNCLANNCDIIACAICYNTFALSFPTSEIWDAHEIIVEYYNFDSDEPHLEKIPHVSSPDHLSHHIEWAASRTCDFTKIIPTKTHPLPNSVYAKLNLANNDWSIFASQVMSLSPSDKTSRLKIMAMRVALVNGYSLEPALSSLNQQRFGSLRQIFSSMTGNDRIYLSTDFEKHTGAFEVCDHRGSHCGEWLFSGIKNADRDDLGRHDIVLQ